MLAAPARNVSTRPLIHLLKVPVKVTRHVLRRPEET